MHELSIAIAIWDLARQHVPAGAVLRRVHIRTAAMRAIEPHSMQWAWNAVMQEQGSMSVALQLTTLPWEMQCRACGRQWTTSELDSRCACGSDRIRLAGDDELRLVSIEVDYAIDFICATAILDGIGIALGLSTQRFASNKAVDSYWRRHDSRMRTVAVYRPD